MKKLLTILFFVSILNALYSQTITTNTEYRWNNGTQVQEESVTPPTPASGYGEFYAKIINSHAYYLNDEGVEFDLTAGGIGSAVNDGNVLSVLVATTAALPASTYANGASGVGATLTANVNGVGAAIDGVTLIVGDRVLIKNQAAQLQNGIYEVTQVGSAGTPRIFTRVTDSDTQSEIDDETVIVQAGTVNKGAIYAQQTSLPVVGTDAITYSIITGLYVTQQSSGTQALGQIPFWTGSPRQLNKGKSTFYFNPVTNQLRIGAPTNALFPSKLMIHQDNAVDYYNLYIEDNGGNHALSQSGHTLWFGGNTNASNHVEITGISTGSGFTGIIFDHGTGGFGSTQVWRLGEFNATNFVLNHMINGGGIEIEPSAGNILLKAKVIEYDGVVPDDGDLLYGDAGDYDVLPLGAAGEVLQVNAGGTQLEWGAGGGGAGEANTASNLGGGLANYSTKVGVDLQFNSFDAADFDLASNLISIDATKWLTITAGDAAYIASGGAAGGDLSGTYPNPSVTDNSHDHNSTTITTNIVSSVDGVTNDAGDVDLIATGSLTITPNDGANTITFGSIPGIILGGTLSAAVNLSSTAYGSVFTNSGFNASENNRQQIMPYAGTIRDLYILTTNTQSATGSLVIAMRKNGASQTVTITVAAGETAGLKSDLVNSFTFAAGDLISIQFINNATANSCNVISWGCRVTQ